MKGFLLMMSADPRLAAVAREVCADTSNFPKRQIDVHQEDLKYPLLSKMQESGSKGGGIDYNAAKWAM